MNSSTEQLTQSLQPSRFSWFRFWASALVSMLCSAVLVIYPNSTHSGDSLENLFAQNIGRSARDSGGLLAWLCLFLVMTVMCYWALGKWKHMQRRAWIGGLIGAPLIAWTLTIPEYDTTIDQPGGFYETPLWFARWTRPFFAVRWLALTAFGIIVLSAVCCYWCQTREDTVLHRGKVVQWFTFHFSRISALAGIILLC